MGQSVRARYDYVRLGVVVIIEDAKGRILLTRRNKQMRIFPHAWVGPGGVVDPGESLRIDHRELSLARGMDFHATR